jgi:hypothetical protein
MIVEAKDVKFFVLKEETAADGARFLKIEGLVFHSSLAVDQIQQKRDGGTLQIDVYLTPARKRLSGSFELKIPLTGTEKILFGPSKSQIWPKQ